MRAEGVLDDLRAIASDAVRMVRTRLELVVIEVQQEKSKVALQVIVACATFFFLSFGILLAVAWLVVSLPEHQRQAVLGILGLLFLAAGVAGGIWLARSGEELPLSSTIDVLKRDESALRGSAMPADLAAWMSSRNAPGAQRSAFSSAWHRAPWRGARHWRSPPSHGATCAAAGPSEPDLPTLTRIHQESTMHLTKLAVTSLCALGLAACASGPGQYANTYNSEPYRSNASDSGYYADYGRVIGIETLGRNDGRTTGAGAVLGGVIGGVLGHQVGSGRGNDVATVAGAVGGAVVGNNIERNRNEGGQDFRIDVRLENGRVVSLIQEELGDIRVGDRVRIDNGRAFRG